MCTCLLVVALPLDSHHPPPPPHIHTPSPTGTSLPHNNITKTMPRGRNNKRCKSSEEILAQLRLNKSMVVPSAPRTVSRAPALGLDLIRMVGFCSESGPKLDP